MATREKAVGLDDVVGEIAGVTQRLLEEGAEAAQIAFALTSVAADMGLQLTGDPLKVLPLMLDAIALRAKEELRKRDAKTSLDSFAEHVAIGAVIH